jgi:hypothetical protein
MPGSRIIFAEVLVYLLSIEAGLSSGESWRNSMKNLILAAVAALGLATTVVPAANASSTVAGDAQATRTQQTGSYSR